MKKPPEPSTRTAKGSGGFFYRQRVDMHHSHAMRWILKACEAIHVLQIDLNHVYLLLACTAVRDSREDG